MAFTVVCGCLPSSIAVLEGLCKAPHNVLNEVGTCTQHVSSHFESLQQQKAGDEVNHMNTGQHAKMLCVCLQD